MHITLCASVYFSKIESSKVPVAAIDAAYCVFVLS